MYKSVSFVGSTLGRSRNDTLVLKIVATFQSRMDGSILCSVFPVPADLDKVVLNRLGSLS